MTKLKNEGRLSTLISSVTVESCADGTMKVTPTYKGVRPYNERDGGGPSLLTRLATAVRMEKFLNRHLQRRGSGQSYGKDSR